MSRKDKSNELKESWEIIKFAFKKSFNQPKIFLIPLYIILLVVFGGFLGVLLFFSTGVLSLNNFVPQINFNLILPLIISSLIALLIALVIAWQIIVLNLSLLGLAKDIVLNKKINLMKSMKIYGQKYWLRYLGIYFIIGLIISIFYGLILGLNLNLIYFLGKDSSLILALSSLSFIAMFFLLLFFYLSPYYLILKNKSVIDSISQSFKVVRKNYLLVVYIALFFFIGHILLKLLIPFIGIFLSLLLGAIEAVAFMRFINKQ